MGHGAEYLWIAAEALTQTQVSHSCAWIGSPCLRRCVHGASIAAIRLDRVLGRRGSPLLQPSTGGGVDLREPDRHVPQGALLAVRGRAARQPRRRGCRRCLTAAATGMTGGDSVTRCIGQAAAHMDCLWYTGAPHESPGGTTVSVQRPLRCALLWPWQAEGEQPSQLLPLGAGRFLDPATQGIFGPEDGRMISGSSSPPPPSARSGLSQRCVRGGHAMRSSADMST
jgi:hypothetical protein